MTFPFNPYLIRRPRGTKSRFIIDSELAEFMGTIGKYHTLKELRLLLVEHFGEKRAPSKSSIHRYIQRITRGGA